ncbi:MAG: helicase-associated domain-containing protein [Planctomycetes bacterium]|nr:helicase-associated domain-containing protein [Planctomycetota bacterium]
MTEAAANPIRRFRAAELDLLGVLEVVIARGPKVLKNGLPNLAFFRAANAALARPDGETEGAGFTQVEFWLSLARELELVEVIDGCLQVTAAADEFYSAAADERLAMLRRAWLESRDLNEFALSHELELPSLKRGRTVDVTTDIPLAERMIEARREVVRIVEALLDETTLPDLIRRLERESRDLFISHQEDGSWRQVYYRGIRERGGREDVERDGSWELVEGAVLRLMCALPLDRLGWIEYEPRGQVITPLAEGPPAEPSFEAVVQPNFEVVALGDRPDPAALWRLARFTTPRPEGRVRTYVLERKPFADALGRGHSAAELIEFLAGLSRAPLPQNVRFSLDDWATLSERIKIWPDALLIEAEGVEDLSALLPARLLERLQPSRLSGGHYACPAPAPDALREVVPPRRTLLDYSRRLPPVIAPGEDTALVAPREELHLRARQLLALVSRGRSTDRYELDPTLVEQSAAALGSSELMRRIREGLSKSLSATLGLALRTWAGEFTRPYAGNAEVFLAENREQAELLDEMPEFRRWVDRRLAPGIFLLRAGGTAGVRELLKRLGIPMRDDARGR